MAFSGRPRSVRSHELTNDGLWAKSHAPAWTWYRPRYVEKRHIPHMGVRLLVVILYILVVHDIDSSKPLMAFVEEMRFNERHTLYVMLQRSLHSTYS